MPPPQRQLTHLDQTGAARMVDVAHKATSRREATAVGFLRLQPATLELIQSASVAKGDALAVARIAAIQAAKATSSLIPLCHQLPLSSVTVDFSLETDGITMTATARTTAQTGVEMEALTAVSIAALTLYDMLKAADSHMIIEQVRLVAKSKRPVGRGSGETSDQRSPPVRPAP